MRIVIDMQACQSPFSATRGVGRYTDNLVRTMLALAGQTEIYLALNGALGSVERIRHEYRGLLPKERIIVCQNHLKTQYSFNREIERPKEAIIRISEIVWETFMDSVRPDIIFSPNLQEGFSDQSITSVHRIDTHALYATTLHDLTPYYFEEDLLTDQNVREWYERKISDAVKSDIIIAVSHSTKDDIKRLLGREGNHIHAIHSGYDDQLFKQHVPNEKRGEALAKYNIPDDFIFYFGGGDLCKNIPRLLEAYSLLDERLRSKYPLVLGGRSFKYDPFGDSHNELKTVLTQLGLEIGDIITPGFIADEELPALLASCSCFIFPSTHEGFGLPALEAMACGAPVIGSNRSAVAEVIETPSALFDPYDPGSIASKIEQVLTDGTFNSDLREAGIGRAACFSWISAAQNVLNVFGDAVESRPIKQGQYKGDPTRKIINAVRPFVGELDAQELSSLARMLDESFHPAGLPAIYLDVSSVVQQDDRSGVQRVTRAIAVEMIANPPAPYIVDLVYATSDHDDFYRASAYKRKFLGLTSSGQDDYIAFKPGDILIFLDLAPRMAINHTRYIKYLRDIGVKVYFIVHDLIPLHHPEWFSAGGVEEFGELMETVITADGAICVSQSTANDLKAFAQGKLGHRHTPFCIGYSHLGTNYERSAPTAGLPDDAADILLKCQERPTFLIIGTLEPRKGHKQSLAAFEQLWLAGIDVNLMIVGRWGWKMGEFDQVLLDHEKFGERLFWLRDISDEYLSKIYDVSSCLLAPSQAEGFGLPLIEAAERGLPILARDIGIFREVANGSADFFADELEPEVISSAVKNWLEQAAGGLTPNSADVGTRKWSETAADIKAILTQNKWLYCLPPS